MSTFQPPAYWAELFAEHGFVRDDDFDPSVVSPHAMFLRKAKTLSAAIPHYERKLWSTNTLLRSYGEQIEALEKRLLEFEGELLSWTRRASELQAVADARVGGTRFGAA